MSFPLKLARERGCRVERRGIFLLGCPRDFRRLGHELDLFQLSFFESKKNGHLDDLAGTNKIVGVGTELFYSRAKLATTHSFRNIEAEHAFAVLAVVRTKFTNYHGYLSFYGLRASNQDLERGVFQSNAALHINAGVVYQPKMRWWLAVYRRQVLM